MLAAYGWSDLLPSPASGRGAGGEGALNSETLLVRLVALNAERAAEEAQGQVRWLRPEYQHPTQAPQQTEIAMDDADSADSVGRVSDSVTRQTKAESRVTAAPWPATLPEQVAAVARVLAA